MDRFERFLNWKLAVGSHGSPGQDGGTCILEASLVAAGYEYRPIISADDMPECFSRPICRLAMLLNDEASDVERQQLLLYLTRLACADSPQIESERANYILRHNVKGLTYQQRVNVLEGALALGRQANPQGPDEVKARLDDVRRSVPSKAPLDTFLASEGWYSH